MDSSAEIQTKRHRAKHRVKHQKSMKVGTKYRMDHCGTNRLCLSKNRLTYKLKDLLKILSEILLAVVGSR